MSPNETVEEAKAEFEAYIEAICNEDPWLRDNRPELEWLGTCWQAFSADENSELIQQTKANFEMVRNETTEVTGMACATDGPLYARYLGIPFVLIGAGGMLEAHQVNESISIPDNVDVCKIIAATILDWCGYEV